MSSKLRLNVYLAHQGVCSRRKAMDLIADGRVQVNGRLVSEPSTPVDPAKDQVTVGGQAVTQKKYEYVLLNKPADYVTTREDKFAEKTVLELLPAHLRHLNPVGRLDKNTEGLLLLTNDGALANHLTHPKFDVDKTYVVKIQKPLTEAQQKQLGQGIVIDGKKTAPARVEAVRFLKPGCEFLLTIHEGRKRQVRLMLAKIGHYVTYLKRVRQGPLHLGDLPRGKFRMLTKEEVTMLKGEMI